MSSDPVRVEESMPLTAKVDSVGELDTPVDDLVSTCQAYAYAFSRDVTGAEDGLAYDAVDVESITLSMDDGTLMLDFIAVVPRGETQ